MPLNSPESQAFAKRSGEFYQQVINNMQRYGITGIVIFGTDGKLYSGTHFQCSLAHLIFSTDFMVNAIKKTISPDGEEITFGGPDG